MRRYIAVWVIGMVILSLAPAISGGAVSAQNVGGSSVERDLLEAVQTLNPAVSAVLLTVSILIWRAYQGALNKIDEVRTRFEEYLIDELNHQHTVNVLRPGETIRGGSSYTPIDASKLSSGSKPQ